MMIRPAELSEIEKVIFNEKILSEISEDNATPSLPNAYYIGGFDDDVIGILMLIPLSSRVAEAHVHVLPDRREHSKWFGRESLNWAWENTEFTKLVAQIPFCCENVKVFAEKCGFEVEGINRKSWLKNGVMWDSWYLGLLRAE